MIGTKSPLPHLRLKVKILNQTRNTLLSGDAKLATSFLDRLFGLLNKSNPRALIFKTQFGIHTFFLKEAIDVVVLDNKNQVKKIKKCLKPNRLFFWNPKYETVIELPKGTLKKSKTSLDDKLKII